MHMRRIERAALARCFLSGCLAAAVFAACAVIEDAQAYTACSLPGGAVACPVPPWWHPIPSLKQALSERRENVRADAAGVLYYRVPYRRWCAYTDCYW
jgi:hypothetical protein